MCTTACETKRQVVRFPSGSTVRRSRRVLKGSWDAAYRMGEARHQLAAHSPLIISGAFVTEVSTLVMAMECNRHNSGERRLTSVLSLRWLGSGVRGESILYRCLVTS